MPESGASYARRLERQSRKDREVSNAGREIGEPELAEEDRPSPEVFERGRTDLAFFCRQVFPEDFPLDWSDAHLQAIRTLEDSIQNGGVFALAMPRGSGKTTLTRAAATWGVLYGHRRYIVLIGAEQTHADELLEAVKTELETNETLFAWFPRLIWPIRRLERLAVRAKGQLYLGEPTRIEWSTDKVVLPSIEDEPAAGAVFAARGIKGRLRGQLHKLASGRSIRPDYAILDDPQTDESAASLVECEKRERIIQRAVMRLCGPRVKMAATMLCTVIRKGDLADRMLDRDLHPEWRGQRTKMLVTMPQRLDLWEGPYDELRRAGLREERGLADATANYLANQAEMDRGARASWDCRFNPDEASAIQHAMNFYLEDKAAFAAEAQQEPAEEGDTSLVTEEKLVAKVSPLEPGVCPLDTTKVTAFVDVQDSLLYWLAVAWRQGFSGEILAYGSWPQQPDPYFTLERVRFPLGTKYSGGPDAQITAGLRDLLQQLYRDWPVDTGGTIPTSRILVDGAHKTRTIRQALHDIGSPVTLHGFGRGITAAQNPLNHAHKRKSGEVLGAEWRQIWTPDTPRQRYLIWDANHWRSFVASRLVTARGDRGSLDLHAGNRVLHRMLFEHLTAEAPVRTHGRGRDCDEWKLRAGRSDNHLWDCLVGAAVAASYEGVKLDEDMPHSSGRPQVKRPSFAELAKRRLG